MADDLGPLPRIHPRESICKKRQHELEKVIGEWRRETAKTLTTAELLSTIAQVLHEELCWTLRTAIRIERHGDADKPGGLE